MVALTCGTLFTHPFRTGCGSAVDSVYFARLTLALADLRRARRASWLLVTNEFTVTTSKLHLGGLPRKLVP